jgi:hypothetical protein
MPVRLFLRITALTTAVIGLSFILLPVTMVNFFLADPISSGAIFVRFLGSSLVGYSFLNAYASMYNHLYLVKANLIGNFATLTIAFALSIIGVVSGSLNKSGLLIVALHLVFGAGFGWYLYRLKRA